MSISTAIVIMATGFVLGPGYYLYCTQLSGEQVGKFSLSERVNTWEPPSGGTLNFDAMRGFKPFSINLDPQMNPVLFNWQGDVSGVTFGVSQWKSIGYKASLYLGSQLLMAEAFSISLDEKDNRTSWTSTVIGSVNISHPGQYYFVLEEMPKPTLTANGIKIEVRRNVLIPNKLVLISGVVLLVVGFVLIFFMLWQNDKNSRRSRAAI